MRRSTLVLDRLAALVAGVALLGLGAALIAWPSGWLADRWPATPDRISTGADDVVTAPWWPWAAGVAGAVVVLVAAWWLLAHLPVRGVGALLLTGSDGNGRLALAPAGSADSAASMFAETPGVRSARARVVRERGTTVVDLTATLEPHADLAEVALAADAVAADLQDVLGRDDVAARVDLTVAGNRRALPRVH
ncbi:hypothetical protein [Cryptosporangium arvum]|uniref:hypothetical protein n=1 Tax=Cryptosporangium arvum TaxID=80871 RepID=UPI0004ADBA46|nr:hypothetical protein [Cryptosporangium arvum]